MWPFTPVVETLLQSSNEMLFWHRQTYKRRLLTRESSVCHWLLREADPSCSLSQWLRRLPIGPCVITGINSLLSMATPCVTQWGIPGHVGITSTGLNGSPFLLSKPLAPTYYRLVKVNLTTALAKNFNTAATKNKEKEEGKCQTRWAPSGPSYKLTKLGELHMGPSVYIVTTRLFVF